VAWHANAVRLPLNEDCWLGINGATAANGDAYRRTVTRYVRALHRAGLVVILDLHWNAPGAAAAMGQQLMADADHAPTFWRSVARAFRHDAGVVFDLYNEPKLSASRIVSPATSPWQCWLRGCTVRSPVTPAGPEVPWQTAGMQALIDTIRSVGAPQPIMLGGLEGASDLDGFPTQQLHDDGAGRGRQLIASFHAYWYGVNGAKCVETTQPGCDLSVQEQRWGRELGTLLGRTPIVVGEIGEFDCTSTFVDHLMDWADGWQLSYLAWAWVPASCDGYPALVSGYDGSPTPFGEGVRAHLALGRPS
jgi:hypothetical protein